MTEHLQMFPRTAEDNMLEVRAMLEANVERRAKAYQAAEEKLSAAVELLAKFDAARTIESRSLAQLVDSRTGEVKAPIDVVDEDGEELETPDDIDPDAEAAAGDTCIGDACVHFTEATDEAGDVIAGGEGWCHRDAGEEPRQVLVAESLCTDEELATS